MKSVFIVALALLSSTMFSSCNKGEDTYNLQEGTWIIDGTLYTAAYVTKNVSVNSLTAIDLNSNGVNIYFHQLPTSDGTYKIVRSPKQSSEVAVYAVLQDSTRVFASSDNEKQMATVSIKNNKIQISIPRINVTNIHQPDEETGLQAFLLEK